jgi:hypothetical protein
VAADAGSRFGSGSSLAHPLAAPTIAPYGDAYPGRGIPCPVNLHTEVPLMPSTVTRPTSTRLKPDEIDRLRRLAKHESVTLSSLLARLAREGMTRLAAA